MKKQEDLNELMKRRKKTSASFVAKAMQVIVREIAQMIRSYGFEFEGEVQSRELNHLRIEPRTLHSITPRERWNEEVGTLAQFLLMRRVFSETEGEKQYCFLIFYSEFPKLAPPVTRLEVECFVKEGSVTQMDNPFVQVMLRP